MEKVMKDLIGDFIRKCFTDLSFCNRWINQIMQCMTTTIIRVVINGKTGNTIHLERIRQGDLIFQYMLTACIEYHRLCIHFTSTQPKSDTGIKLNKDCPNIPCLMFANNCIVFHKATKKAAG